jgi:hypothetical protein
LDHRFRRRPVRILLLFVSDAKSARILIDFTGDSYRLIFEEGHDSLADYEKSLAASMGKKEWKPGIKNLKCMSPAAIAKY